MLTSIVQLLAPNSDLGMNIFPPAPKFDPKRDIPDQSGKVFIVTGSNTGIGYVTVQELLKKNAKVYLAARSKDKAEAAIERLKQDTGKTAIWLKLDLGDLQQVKKAAEEFLEKESKLNVLVNNAGLGYGSLEDTTQQGYDLTFGTNVLGPYYFTSLLIPALKAGSQASNEPSRVINVSSTLHNAAPGAKEGSFWDKRSLKAGKERDEYLKEAGTGFSAKHIMYGQSKAANIVHADYLARQAPGVVVAASLHPGVLKSEFSRSMGFMAMFLNMVASPVELGALTTLYASTTATPEQINGKYLVPWARFGEPLPRMRTPSHQDELASWCDEQIKLAKL